ncbi:MAG: 50S ribosomal protein L1 [Ignisphaera sp.]|nr:50S ribosomal protein L1 [Ignisphaera sp.]
MSIKSPEFIDALKKSIQLALATKRPWKYPQSVELIVTFKDVDVKKQPEFRFRDAVLLPKGIGKKMNVCVVVDDAQVQEAQKAGAAMVISKSELSKIDKKAAKKIAEQCNWILVRADLMGLAGRVLGPALGPRGKVPVPLPPNASLSEMVMRYSNTTRLHSKEQPWVGCKIGLETMSLDDLVENALAVLSYIEDKVKRPLLGFAKIYVKTTSSPSIEVA